MTDWVSFTLLGQNIVAYMTGSYLGLGILASVFFIILFAASGIDLKYVFPLTIPIIGAFAFAGLFGDFSWIVNVVLLIIAFIYGFAMYSLLN